MIVDDLEPQVGEYPVIDTTEVLVQCPVEATDENSNEMVVLSSQEDNSPVQFCPVCSNGFLSPEMLTEHLKDHPVCPVCCGRVLSFVHLQDHMESHPVCPECGDKFL